MTAPLLAAGVEKPITKDERVGVLCRGILRPEPRRQLGIRTKQIARPLVERLADRRAIGLRFPLRPKVKLSARHRSIDPPTDWPGIATNLRE